MLFKETKRTIATTSYVIDLDQAIIIARATESAEQDVELMAGKAFNHLRTSIDGTFEDEKKSACFRCGNEGHKAESCWVRSLDCRKFGRIGHVARVCRSKQSQGSTQRFEQSNSSRLSLERNRKKFKIQAASRNWLSEGSTYEDDFEPVFCLNKKDSCVPVVINNQNVKMVVDTGSKQNIISSCLYRALFQRYELQKTKKIFTAYVQQKPPKSLAYFYATLQDLQELRISVQGKWDIAHL